MSPRRLLRFRLFTLLMTPLLTLSALETICQFVVPDELPMPAESTENAARVDNSRNTFGLRERWQQVPGDDRTLRVAFVGDSFTFAVGVEQEEGFVHKVEGLLNAPGGRRVVTINVGDPGTDPVEQSSRLGDIYDRLHPEVVVQVVYCNDLGHDLYDELKKIHALQDRRSQLAEHSYLWRFAERRIRYRRVLGKTLDYFRGGDSPLMREQSWRRLERGLRDTQTVVQEKGGEYRIVLFPWLFELEDYPLRDVHQKMRALALRLGAPYLDLLDTLGGQPARVLRISVIDEHPSVMCHDLVARGIANWLGDSIVAPSLQLSTKRADDLRPDS